MKYLLFILIQFVLSSAHAGDVCRNSGQVPLGFDNSEMWIEQTKALSIEAAKKDLKGFCEWNRMDRATGDIIEKSLDKKTKSEDQYKKYRTIKNAGERDNAAGYVLEVGKGTMAKNPWNASLAGHPLLKRRTSIPFTTFCRRHENCRDTFYKAFQINDLNSDYDVPVYEARDPLSVSQSQIRGACVFLSPLYVIGCSQASNELIEIVTPRKKVAGRIDSGIEVSPAVLIQETMADQKITKALQAVASKLWKNIAKNTFEPQDNIHSDLSAALVKEGFTADDSKKQSLKILGAISSGGPNFYTRINSGEIRHFPQSCMKPESCNPNGIFMAAIALGIAEADSVKMAMNDPSPYSLPEGSDFPCDSGKAYHFWSTAALTDRLIDRGYSAGAARAAVYSSHIGYHLRESKSRTNNVLSMQRFGSVENGIRMDLNLAAAGVSFGSRIKEINGADKLNMQAGLVQTLENSNTSPATEDKFTSSPTQVYEWTDRNAVKSTFGFYP